MANVDISEAQWLRVAKAVRAVEDMPRNNVGDDQYKMRAKREFVCGKITGNADGGGQYVGRTVGGSSTCDGASGDLAMPEGMTVAGTDNAIFINPREVAGHSLPANTTWVIGRIVGKVPSGTHEGKTIVWIEQAFPRPTQKYTVLTPIDDTLEPIWTSARFQ